LFVLTLVTFYPVTRNGFVNYDDPDYITHNLQVQHGLSPGNIAWAFSTAHAGNYHPLTWISLMLDRTLWGASPTGFHTTNVVLHALSGMLLFLILNRATGATWRSALAAAIFALHPLRVESVAWATERKDVLSMFFTLLTFAAYVRYATRPGWMRYAIVALMLELALLSKSTAVTLPAILLLLDFWPLRRVKLDETDTSELRRPIKWLVVEKLPLLGLSIVACTATMIAQSAGHAIGSMEKYPLGARLGNAFVAYARYMRKWVWPTDLAVFYPNNRDIPAWLVAVSLIVLIGVTVVALRRRSRSPSLTVGWLWFLGAMVPMIGLVQSGAQSMADRFTYLPMIGLAIAAAWAIPQVCFDTQRRRMLFGTVATSLLVAMTAVTRAQIHHWHDSETLFAHAIAVTEDNHVAHNNLAFELAHREQFAAAKRHYEAALAINPAYSVAHNGLGSVRARTGDSAGAAREYALAVQLNPNYAIAHRNLAGHLAAAGQLDQAIAHYQRATELQPHDAAARSLLAMTLAQTGRLNEALPHFIAAADEDPQDVQAQVNLGHALNEIRRPSEALVALQRALALDPKSPDAHYHAGAARAQLGDLAGARDDFRKTLALRPQDREAQGALDQVMAAMSSRSASVAE
jgi:Flp pilus assembly protein TadD